MQNPTKTAILTLPLAILLAQCPTYALTAERWSEIQEQAKAIDRNNAYRPKSGDNCFVIEDDVAWTTPAAQAVWLKKFRDEYLRLGASGDFPDKQFKDATVATNADLVTLDRGIEVKVLEGIADPSGLGFIDMSGKIEILTGNQAGKVCYCNGAYLKKLLISNGFLKTEEEKNAQRAIFTAQELNKPLADMLREAGITIDPPVAGNQSVLTHVGGGKEYVIPCQPHSGEIRFGQSFKDVCKIMTEPTLIKRETDGREVVYSLKNPTDLALNEVSSTEQIKVLDTVHLSTQFYGVGIIREPSLFFKKDDSGDWALSGIGAMKTFSLAIFQYQPGKAKDILADIAAKLNNVSRSPAISFFSKSKSSSERATYLRQRPTLFAFNYILGII